MAFMLDFLMFQVRCLTCTCSWWRIQLYISIRLCCLLHVLCKVQIQDVS